MDVGFGLQVEESTRNMNGMSDSNGSPISSYMGNSPLSGGPMNAWGPASPGDAKKAGNKADTKRADSPGKKSPVSPKAASQSPKGLNDFGVDIEDDDEEYEEEEEEEDEDEDEDE